MRMLFQAGVLLLTLQVLVHGQNVENVTASTGNAEDGFSVHDNIQNVVTESIPSYTKLADIIKDNKSQKEATTSKSTRNTGTDMPEVTANKRKTDNNVVAKITPAQKPSRLPDPMDRYSNSILLQGHVFGISDNVMTMIHMALSSSNTFVPVEPLRVNALESSYEEMGYEGDKYTQIRYVVSYNGNMIHTEVITRLMSTPKVAHHFKKQLDKQQLREYKAAKSVKNQSWIHEHLAAVVVPSCIAFVIILTIVFVVARKRSTTISKLEQKKKSCKSNVVSDKKCKPPPYSVDNPAYNL